jgi:ArsR family transcriptional regulator, arsenate/arsenite/antimonite-responsive transcriptional repressor
MTTNLKKIEKISKALGDVNRLKILQLMAKHQGTGLCAAIQECVELAQPSVSHHIKILTEAGLIEAEKEGRNHKYTINTEVFKEYLAALAEQVNLNETA